MDAPQEGSRFNPVRVIRESTNVVKSKIADTGKKISEVDSEIVIKSVRRSPVIVKRAMLDSSISDLITKVPVITVILCLTVTALLGRHSGILDCRDGFEHDFCDEEGALNVNGDMAVYLPQGSDVQKDIEDVEQNWTTNVMVIYVESERQGVDQLPILKQIDKVESALNTVRDDRGCLLYTSPSPRDVEESRMPSSA